MKRLELVGLCFGLVIVLIFGSIVVNLFVPVYAQGEYVVFPETASVSTTADVTPLKFMLKAISKPSGEVEKVTGFKIDPT